MKTTFRILISFFLLAGLAACGKEEASLSLSKNLAVSEVLLV